MKEPIKTTRINGTQDWRVDGELHCLGGPAIIWADGTQAWYVNGNRHRIDGPAFIWADGDLEWWVDDREITKEVNTWTKEHDVSWPWDEETQMLFLMKFL